MEHVKEFRNQCLLNKLTPISQICSYIDDGNNCFDILIMNPDHTTQWFRTIADILLSNFDKLPDVSLCKKFSDLYEEKEISMVKIIEKIKNRKDPPKCKKCTQNAKELFSDVDVNTTLYSEYVDLTKQLRQQSDCFCHKDDILDSIYENNNNKYDDRVKQLKKIINSDDVFQVAFFAFEYWDNTQKKFKHKVKVFNDTCDLLPSCARKHALVAHLLNGGTFKTYIDFQPNDQIVKNFIQVNKLE